MPVGNPHGHMNTCHNLLHLCAAQLGKLLWRMHFYKCKTYRLLACPQLQVSLQFGFLSEYIKLFTICCASTTALVQTT